jgi:NTP pyrophosphatase (non-canonical NTP hydrolase)
MLDLATLREANLLRSKQYKNARGELVAQQWGLSQWSNACLGELGEAANVIKKIERGDFTLDTAREDLGKELADVMIYLDLLAHAAGISLDTATINKFNEVSERVCVDVYLRVSQTMEKRVVISTDGGGVW